MSERGTTQKKKTTEGGISYHPALPATGLPLSLGPAGNIGCPMIRSVGFEQRARGTLLPGVLAALAAQSAAEYCKPPIK